MGSAGKMLILDGRELILVEDGEISSEQKLSSTPLEVEYSDAFACFFLLTSSELLRFSPNSGTVETVFSGTGFVSMAVNGEEILIAKSEGFLLVEADTGKEIQSMQTAIPATPIRFATTINGKYWFGSDLGAFMLRNDGKYNYYYGERWLPSNQVVHIAAGPDSSVLILTDRGLAQLKFEQTTLARKAEYYEQQVRQRHIRFGFNADLTGIENGLPASGRLKDSDNDGLWTSMYLASQAFKYASTGSREALTNCEESLLAMERLFTINPVAGFPSRSFERHGYIDQLSDRKRWQHAHDPIWDWKATTSSDEAIGHMFAYGVLAEVVEDDSIKARAIRLMDALMTHILDHDLYLVDYDGQPTTWGRWHPDYVNARPTMVGDRKLNSSNIISMLQTAFHFTQKEKYKTKAYELMNEYGYLENLLRPMEEIGSAPEEADDWSKMLSESWNHSDDEMYYLGYWGLYRYAFTDSLRELYREAIIDHWEIERPEKEGLWNIMTSLVGVEDYDLDAAMWYLREYPLDMLNWDVQNSHRKDLTFLDPNFRKSNHDRSTSP